MNSFSPDFQFWHIFPLIPFWLLSFPLIALNVLIGLRKSISLVAVVFVSLIPLVNLMLLFYLISMTDKEVVEKLDRILEKQKRL